MKEEISALKIVANSRPKFILTKKYLNLKNYSKTGVVETGNFVLVIVKQKYTKLVMEKAVMPLQ